MQGGDDVDRGGGSRGDAERGTAGRSGGDGGPGDGISALQLANVLLRNRRVVVVVPLLLAAVVVGVTLVLPPAYTTTASIMPESSDRQASQLSGLASQFGVSVPVGQAGQSPQFYGELLRSRELLRKTAVTEYSITTGSDTTRGDSLQGDLSEFLDVAGGTRRLVVAKTIGELREITGVSTNPEVGLVELSVTTPWPDLSQQVAARMVDLVNHFNLERRQSQASAERRFIEEQVARAESVLRAAEDSLEMFLENNRQYENSPELQFQHDRLRRRVTLHQQLYTSLSQSYQQAKIDEVRNTPVVTVVEPPEVPARPDSRDLLLKGVLALLIGTMISVFWAVCRELLVTSRERSSDDYNEFARLKEETKEDLRTLVEGLTAWRQ